MQADLDAFDNTKVAVSEVEGKGRALVARQDLSVHELIIRSPVKLLDPMEYQVLRLIPAIRRFLSRQPDVEGTDALNGFMVGMMRLMENPDDVLGVPHGDDDDPGTIMHTFTWPRTQEDGDDTAALAFGLSSLCNHAPEGHMANAELVRDPDGRHIDLVAIKTIGKGEEILIRYASTPFEAV